MVEIKRIDSDHPLYAQEVDLRRRVLLEPIGLSVERYLAEHAEAESRAEHFVGVIDHPSGARVVACGCLIAGESSPEVGKLTQMAVDPQRQGEGVGRQLVVELERRAFGELDLTRLYCHAQLAAIGFYERLGWEIEGEEFQEEGIAHKKMVINA